MDGKLAFIRSDFDLQWDMFRYIYCVSSVRCHHRQGS